MNIILYIIIFIIGFNAGMLFSGLLNYFRETEDRYEDK